MQQARTRYPRLSPRPVGDDRENDLVSLLVALGCVVALAVLYVVYLMMVDFAAPAGV